MLRQEVRRVGRVGGPRRRWRRPPARARSRSRRPSSAESSTGGGSCARRTLLGGLFDGRGWSASRSWASSCVRWSRPLDRLSMGALTGADQVPKVLPGQGRFAPRVMADEGPDSARGSGDSDDRSRNRPRPSGEDVPSLLATSMPDGSVRCVVCAHRCLVRPGRAGICGVRENRDGVLWSTAYGAAVAVAMDPIEKKPLFHVAPGQRGLLARDAPAARSTASSARTGRSPRDRDSGCGRPAFPLPPERAVAEALEPGARSIAYTYVEPTVFLEYALAIGPAGARGRPAQPVHHRTATRRPRRSICSATVLDAANVDLKSFDDAFYRRRCGARLAPRPRGAGGLPPRRRLAGGDDAGDPGRERRPGRAARADRLAGRAPGTRDALARQPLLPGVPDDATTRRRRWPRSGAPPRSAGRPACATSTSGNAPELAMEDTHCVGCGAPAHRHAAATASLRRLADDGTCPSCGRELAGRAPRGERRRRTGPVRMSARPGGVAGPPARPRCGARRWRAASIRPTRSTWRELVDGLLADAVRPSDAATRPRRPRDRPASSCRTPGSSTAATSPPSRGALAAGLAGRSTTIVMLGTNHRARWLDGVGVWDARCLADAARRRRGRRGARRGDRRPSARRSRSTATRTRPSTRSRSSCPFVAGRMPGARIVPLAVATGTGTGRRRAPGERARRRCSRRVAPAGARSAWRSARTWRTTRRRRSGPRSPRSWRRSSSPWTRPRLAQPRGGHRPVRTARRRLRHVRHRAERSSGSRRSVRWASSVAFGSRRPPRPTPVARPGGRSATWRRPSRAERRPLPRRSAWVRRSSSPRRRTSSPAGARRRASRSGWPPGHRGPWR